MLLKKKAIYYLLFIIYKLLLFFFFIKYKELIFLILKFIEKFLLKINLILIIELFKNLIR